MAHAISEKRKSLRKQLSALRVDDKQEWRLGSNLIEPARSTEFSGFGSAKNFSNRHFDFKHRYGAVAKKGGSSMDVLPEFQFESRNLFPSRVETLFNQGYNHPQLTKPFGQSGSLLNSRSSLTTSYDSPRTTRAFADSSRHMGSIISNDSRTHSRVKFEFSDAEVKVDERKLLSQYRSHYKQRPSPQKEGLSETYAKLASTTKSQSKLRKPQEPEVQTRKKPDDSNKESIKTDDVLDKTQTQFAAKGQKRKLISSASRIEGPYERPPSFNASSKDPSLEDNMEQTKVRNFYSAKRYPRKINSQYCQLMLTSIPEENKKTKARQKGSDYYIGPLLQAFDQEEKTEYFAKIRVSHFEDTVKQFQQYQGQLPLHQRTNLSRPICLADSLGPSHLRRYLILDLDETLVYCSKLKMNVGAVQVELPIPPFKVC